MTTNDIFAIVLAALTFEAVYTAMIVTIVVAIIKKK